MLLAVSRSRLKLTGDRALAANAPKLWNSLHLHIRPGLYQLLYSTFLNICCFFNCGSCWCESSTQNSSQHVHSKFNTSTAGLTGCWVNKGSWFWVCNFVKKHKEQKRAKCCYNPTISIRRQDPTGVHSFLTLISFFSELTTSSTAVEVAVCS